MKKMGYANKSHKMKGPKRGVGMKKTSGSMHGPKKPMLKTKGSKKGY